MSFEQYLFVLLKESQLQNLVKSNRPEDRDLRGPDRNAGLSLSLSLSLSGERERVLLIRAFVTRAEMNRHERKRFRGSEAGPSPPAPNRSINTRVLASRPVHGAVRIRGPRTPNPIFQC